MDPLSAVGVAASVLALAEGALKMSKHLYTFSSQLYSAAGDVQELADDLEDFSRSLKHLARLLKDSNSWFSNEIYLLTTKIIQKCAKLYENIDRMLAKLGANSRSTWKVRMKFVYKDAQIQTLMKRLQSMKLTLATILMSLQIELALSLLQITAPSGTSSSQTVIPSDERLEILKEEQHIPVAPEKASKSSGLFSTKMMPTGLTSRESTVEDSPRPSPPLMQSFATITGLDGQASSVHVNSVAGALFAPMDNQTSNLTTQEATKPRSLKSLSSIESFKSAVSIQRSVSLSEICQQVKAIRGVLHAFETASDTLSRLVEIRLQREDEVHQAAILLQQSLINSEGMIRKAHRTNCKNLGTVYIEVFNASATHLSTVETTSQCVMRDIAMPLQWLIPDYETLRTSAFLQLQHASERLSSEVIKILEEVAHLADGTFSGGDEKKNPPKLGLISVGTTSENARLKESVPVCSPRTNVTRSSRMDSSRMVQYNTPATVEIVSSRSSLSRRPSILSGTVIGFLDSTPAIAEMGPPISSGSHRRAERIMLKLSAENDPYIKRYTSEGLYRKENYSQACDNCRLKKIRCDDLLGACSYCLQSNTECSRTRKKMGSPPPIINRPSSLKARQDCDRCRDWKLRCDKSPGGCSRCLQNNNDCQTTDRIPRGYMTLGPESPVQPSSPVDCDADLALCPTFTDPFDRLSREFALNASKSSTDLLNCSLGESTHHKFEDSDYSSDLFDCTSGEGAHHTLESQTWESCLVCSSRGVECGEEKPQCNGCQTSGLSCTYFEDLYIGSYGVETGQMRTGPGSDYLPLMQYDPKQAVNEAIDPYGSNITVTCTKCLGKTTIRAFNPEINPLCNACGLEVLLHGVARGIDSSTSSIADNSSQSPKQSTPRTEGGMKSFRQRLITERHQRGPAIEPSLKEGPNTTVGSLTDSIPQRQQEDKMELLATFYGNTPLGSGAEDKGDQSLWWVAYEEYQANYPTDAVVLAVNLESLSIDTESPSEIADRLSSEIKEICLISGQSSQRLVLRDNIIRAMKIVDEQMGLGIATVGWGCVWKIVDLFDNTLDDTLDDTLGDTNILEGYTDILDRTLIQLTELTSLIARYAVMENLYQKSADLSLKPEYRVSLLALCAAMLGYFRNSFSLYRAMKTETKTSGDMSDTISSQGMRDKLVNLMEAKCADDMKKIRKVDIICRAFRVEVDAEDGKSESSECEEISDEDEEKEESVDGSQSSKEDTVLPSDKETDSIDKVWLSDDEEVTAKLGYKVWNLQI